ncbi:hypothetical protein GLOIN_2v1774436 [Rhizophagus irregularis DAOM 181602=DAOM 197198]|nr:hypothetical protein GLOIN_2v1774436 [Rhizophagus irregularis DAOM 181602=DAOM 197198]
MKYAGLSYLGIVQSETAQKLLEGVIFCSFIVEVENITVFVSCLGKITISKTNKIGHNYAASLFHKYRRVQSVFYQHVDKNSFLITIYQNSQIVAEYIDISFNAVWKKTGVLTSILGETLFIINHSLTLDRINQARQELYSHKLPNECTLADWNNKIIMKHLYEFSIIELYTHFDDTYNIDYEFQERDGIAGMKEFWTNTSEPEKDHETIAKLYAEELLYVTSPTCALWDCFRNSYNTNSKEIDGKIHILLIIAEKFTYKEIIEELKIM